MMLSVVLYSIIALCVVLFIRNNLTLRYRLGMIKRISERASDDISQGSSWEWRFQELDAVSYNEMVLKFWRHFDSFYPADPARLDK